MAYLTTAIAKSDWLRIESDNSLDALIGRFITAAEKEITNVIDQPVESETVTLTFTGSGSYQHNLYYHTPVTVTILRFRDTPADSWTTVNASEYTVRNTPYGKALWYNNGFIEGREYEATATVGWASNAVPADIVQCGYELVKELYYETPYAGQSERFGVTAVTEGQGGTTFAKTIQRMRPLIAEKLAHYRRFTL